MTDEELLEDIGERMLIERVKMRFGVERRFERMINAGAGEDDCAIIDFSALIENICGCGGGCESKMIVTTDMLLRSSHFPDGITPFQIGWSAVAVNLSDVAAMGARPLMMTIAMGFPARTRISFFDEVLEGIRVCADNFGTIVIGGDMVKSNELTFAGTCIGFTVMKPLRRSGAAVGDIVCVTGTLGNAALGMYIVSGRLSSEQLKEIEDIAEYAKKALFQPYPRVNEGVLIASSGYATSMIDISDGLAISLAEISRKSNVGFEIWEECMPVSNELREIASTINIDLQELIFHFGGDYELLFTLNSNVLEDRKKLEMLEKYADMRIIGRVVPVHEGIYLRKENEERMEIRERGYQHF